MRPLLVLIHRYIGLTMTIFLLVAGLTGSLLVWNDELDAMIAPKLWRTDPPLAGAKPLDPLVLRDVVAQRYPDAWVFNVDLAQEPGRNMMFFIEGPAATAQDEHAPLPNNQIFVNPYSGQIVGERDWGNLSQGVKNLMPFLYRLHFSLSLGTLGVYAFGIIALLWTLDCFVGAYLTLPLGIRKKERTDVSGWGAMALKTVISKKQKSWLSRWWPAWQVRWGSGNYKLMIDLHRAGGLWVWAMLFVLAWSSVSFNLTQVYHPVMNAFFAHQADEQSVPDLPANQPIPGLSWSAALQRGEALIQAKANAQGWTISAPGMLMYDPHKSLFRYSVRSSLDIGDHAANTVVYYSGRDGTLLGSWLPSSAASGDTIRGWLTALHMAAVWGLPYRLFMTLMGALVAMLTITGLIIWWKKRQSRLYSARQTRPDKQLVPSTIIPAQVANSRLTDALHDMASRICRRKGA